MQAWRKISEAHPTSLMLSPASFQVAQSIHGGQRKGAVERQTERSREGSKQATNQDSLGGERQCSGSLHDSLGRQSTAYGRQASLQRLGLAAILCLDCPDTPQPKPHHMEAGQSCQGAGLRLWPQKEVEAMGG